MALEDTNGRVSTATHPVIVTRRRSIRPRATTMTLPSGRVISAVTPPGLVNSVLILSRGSLVPRTGSSLVVEPGSILPEGFLGQVSGASRNIDGTVTVTAQPTDLQAAYSAFSVAISENLKADNVFLASAASLRHHSPLTRLASISAIPFTCTTKDGWSVSATADFSHTHIDATFDISSRAIHFLFTSDPTFTLTTSFRGSANCKLANANELQVVIPIAAPLALTIKPQFKLDVSGSFEAQATWAPRFAIGFDRAPGISQNPVGFGSSLSFEAHGQADADLYAGLSVELGIGGRVGVTGTLGPHLHASVTTTTHDAQSTGCATVTAWAHAELTANASIFIKSWSWTLYSGDFDKTTLYDHCVSTNGSGSGGGSANGTGNGKNGAGTGSGSGTGSNGGTGSGSGSGSSPTGASITASEGGPFGCSNCFALNIAVHNFPTGTYTYYCHDNSGPGGADTVFFSHTVSVSDPNQSTWPGVFCDDNAPYTAYLVMDGVQSNSVSFSTPAPPPPTPTTYAETTGGVTHTWTNYSNAGGTQGPSIPSHATVQVTCKVDGFKVADGDTWWYRIASSPWNDAYYASADAFYNNGQTSGSLAGTPFVDQNVPNC